MRQLSLRSLVLTLVAAAMAFAGIYAFASRGAAGPPSNQEKVSEAAVVSSYRENPVPMGVSLESAPAAPAASTLCSAYVNAVPTQWPTALGKARGRDALRKALENFLDVKLPEGMFERDTEKPCRGNPVLRAARAEQIDLSESDELEWLLTASFTGCSVFEDDKDDTFQLAAVLRKVDIGKGAYCVVETFENMHSHRECPCMNHPDKQDESDPLEISALAMTNSVRKTLRVETSGGTCSMYPRDSWYRSVFYNLHGFSLESVFETMTYEEKHSAMVGPSTYRKLEPVGGFPKALRVTTDTTCEEREEHKEENASESCTPTRTVALWSYNGKNYQEGEKKTYPLPP